MPFDASAGSPYSVTVTATDDGGPARSGSTTFNWVITNTNRPPAAFDITVFADAGVPVSFVLNGTDPDGDVLSFAIAAPPSQGSLSGGPRLYDYTPAISAGGTDVFTFVVSDGGLQATGTVTVFITPNLPPTGGPDEYDVRDRGVLVIDPPGVLANDSDPEGRPISAIVDSEPAYGTLQLRPDGSFVYRHLGSLADIDRFSYRIDDGMQLSAPISVTLNVEDNLAPVAVADEVVTYEDTAVVIRALDNDYDPNNEAIVVSDVIESQVGTVSWSIDGAFRYTPPPNWHGTGVITYEISDGELTATAVITVEVLPVNDPPVAFEAELTGDSGDMMLIDLSPYATDADGDALDFLLESPPSSPVRKLDAATFEVDLDGVIADLAPLTFIVSDPSGAKDTSSLILRVRIPAELVGIPALVSDDIRRGEDPGGGIAGSTPTGGGPMVTGLRLMVGSVLDTFRAFRFPMLGLIVVLLASLWLGLSKRFAFSATPTLLPASNRRKVDIVMAPSSAGVPVRNEPGSHQSVIHRFAADEIDVIASGARSMLRSEVWVEVETPEGDGWVNSEFLTEQQQAAAFSADDRPGRLVRLFVEALYRSDDLLPMTGGHDLHVARYGPPVRFAAGALPRLLSGASVYWWWGPEGDTPRHQGTFAETVGESFSQAFRNRAAHPFEPTFPIPLEFRNMHSLVVGNDEHGEGWRVFFRFEEGEPLVGGLMREAAPNPAAMHGRNELQWA